jgi:hypothetical protein
MNKYVFSIFVVCIPVIAFAIMDCVNEEFFNVTNSATTGSIKYSNAKSGYVEGLGIVVSNAYQLKTTSAGTTKPHVGDLYFYYNGIFNSSNAYKDMTGTYQIRYETNSEWTISTVQNGAYTGIAFVATAPDIELISTNYQAVSGYATGTVIVAETTVDIDVDVTTTARDGTGLQRTIFTADDITESAFHVIRTTVSGGTTNLTERIPLSMNKVSFNAYDCGDSNAYVHFYLVIESPK